MVLQTMNNPDVFSSRATDIMRAFAALVGLLWSGAIVTGAVDTHYVSLDGTNDSGNGYITWSGAATQIQWAVGAAAASDTVLVSNGTYNLTGQITVATAITLKSFYGTNDAALLAIINGNNYNGKLVTNRCVYIDNTAATVDGFMISNGYASGGSGGGVYINKAGNLRSCVIQGNTVSNDAAFSGGGGVFVGGVNIVGANTTVEYCDIVSNTVQQSPWANNNNMGGGLYNYYGGTIRYCMVRGNWSYYGGGGMMQMGNAGVLTNCTIYGNQAGLYLQGGKSYNLVISNNIGSGVDSIGAPIQDSEIVYNSGAGLAVSYGGVVSNCFVHKNTGGGLSLNGRWGFYIVDRCVIAANNSRGAACTYDGSVRNCLVYCNTNTGASGGGLYADLMGVNSYGYGTGAVYNCTIVSNQCGTQGGGIYLTRTNCVKNCIIYGNNSTGDEYDDVYNNNSYNTNQYYNSCTPIILAPNQGNITNDPLFVDRASRNYHLSANSPCINSGSNQDWMTNSVDLEGRTRIRYGTVDMGAYELIHGGTSYGFR